MVKPKWLKRWLVSGPELLLCLDRKAFRKAVDKCNFAAKPFVGDALAATHIFKGDSSLVIIVCIDRKQVASYRRTQIDALLVHELVHVWRAFCRHICEKSPSEEFEAYAKQAIFQRLAQEYRRQTK